METEQDSTFAEQSLACQVLYMVQSCGIGHRLGGSRGVSVSVYRFGIGRYVK